MTVFQNAFDSAVDDATHAVVSAFDESFSLPTEEDLFYLMVEINDAITAIMGQQVRAMKSSKGVSK